MVDVLVIVRECDCAVLLRSKDVVCRGGMCLRSSFSVFVAVFVRDKVMCPFSDMAAVVALSPDTMMLGVYAAQCYEDRPFMAPAPAARVSGAHSLFCERRTLRVETAVVYTV